jgi:pimeloyl-ACP methyl ester carboxylesterase
MLAVEYRGYGKSEGQPREKDFYRDAGSALRYLVEKRGIDPKTIISYGQSLGTAVATDIASETNVGGVVLEAPFPSIAAMVRRAYWFLPGLSFLAGSQFDTKSKIAKIKAPLLIVQCTSDPVIPPDLGQQVFAAAASPKTLLQFDIACHEESALLAPTKYKAGLRDFLARIEQR